MQCLPSNDDLYCLHFLRTLFCRWGDRIPICSPTKNLCHKCADLRMHWLNVHKSKTKKDVTVVFFCWVMFLHYEQKYPDSRSLLIRPLGSAYVYRWVRRKEMGNSLALFCPHSYTLIQQIPRPNSFQRISFIQSASHEAEMAPEGTLRRGYQLPGQQITFEMF